MRYKRIKGLYLSAKQKNQTRAKTLLMVRSGILKRLPCEVCQLSAVVHHLDYRNPRAIQWLCTVHHADAHRGQKLLPDRPEQLRIMIHRWLHRWQNAPWHHYCDHDPSKTLWYRSLKPTTADD